MKINKTPTKKILKTLFTYNDGVLIWNLRSIEYCKNIHAMNTWNAQNAGKVAGSLNGSGYLQLNIFGKQYRVHRIIYVMHHGEIPDQILIDHINRNPLDNRIENLRLATSPQNKNNTSVTKRNKSGYKGVHWDALTNKWRVQIRFDNKQKHIGLFKNIEDAAFAYKNAAIKYHGNFAYELQT